MFQLGVFLFLSLAVSLSSGQDVTLSESSSSSGTCNITSCSYHRDSGGARVSCDVNTCFEAFNGSGNCFNSDSEFTCSQRSEENGSSLSYTTIELVPGYRLIHILFFPSEPYACLVQGDMCFCRSPGYNGSKHNLLLTLSIGFGFVFVFLFLPIIIFFNCNLASGPNHSFVFFYQCAPLASVVGSPAIYLVMQNVILPAQPGFIVLEYCKYIVVLVVIFLGVFLVKCTSCPLQKCRLPWAKVRRTVRNFREKHIGSTFIHAICSIIVLSYGDLVAISVRVVLGSIFINRSCCYSVVSYPYARRAPCDESYTGFFDASRILRDIFPSHCMLSSECISAFNIIFQYVIPSVVFLLFLLPLPLSLIYYPSIPVLFHKLTGRSHPHFPKLDPVFDVFQGVYKDKMRWFAGVHLLYLMILWVVYVCEADVLPFIFVAILAIHSLFQPFKNRKHNYLETLYLVYLVLMSVGSSYLQSVSTVLTVSAVNPWYTHYRVNSVIISGIRYIFVSLPFCIVIVQCSYKILSKRVCCQKFVAKIKSCYKVEQVELEEEQEVEPHYYEAEWL